MPSVVTVEGRKRALEGLKLAEQFLTAMPSERPEEKKGIVRAAPVITSNALVLALLRDDYVPAELFKPWASVRRIRQWRDDEAHKLDVIIRHGRCCVRPSSFFALWAKLPDESKRSSISSAGQDAGETPSHPGGRVGRASRSANAARG